LKSVENKLLSGTIKANLCRVIVDRDGQTGRSAVARRHQEEASKSHRVEAHSGKVWDHQQEEEQRVSRSNFGNSLCGRSECRTVCPHLV